MHERFKIAVSLIILALIALTAVICQAARNEYIERQGVTEVTVGAMKIPEPGSIQWRINKCLSLVKHEDGRVKTGDFDKYMDCREAAFREAMSRNDI